MKEVEKFEVGEKVAVSSTGTYYTSSLRTYTIKRETPTQYVIDDHLRFRKDDLRQVGDSFSRMVKLTQEIEGKIKYNNALAKTSLLMRRIGDHRNQIRTESTENIEKAQELMEEAIALLEIKI